ncbi:MAG: hypothetical protein IKS05_02505 [Oscillospiraceae bacterium]|nr:hypothetical protein [Oscillospiraceae bacterium]
MKIGKIVGKIALGALVASLIPYRIRSDKETGTCELRSLLWGVKKTPGAEKNSYTVSIPGSALNSKEEEPEASPAEPAVEESAEAPAEEAEAPAAEPEV